MNSKEQLRLRVQKIEREAPERQEDNPKWVSNDPICQSFTKQSHEVDTKSQGGYTMSQNLDHQ